MNSDSNTPNPSSLSASMSPSAPSAPGAPALPNGDAPKGRVNSPANGGKPAELTFTFPDGTTKKVPAGTTAQSVIQDCPSPFPVVAAYLDNKICALERQLSYSGAIEPLHLGMRDGALIYRRSLCFLLVRAVQEIYPDLRVYINHALSKGYYVELHSHTLKNVRQIIVTQGDVEKIKARMHKIVEADEAMIRREVPIEEAIRIFEKAGQSEKVQLLRSCSSETVTVYTCGDSTNHFYGYMAPSTGYLKVFDLIPEPPGFVLLFPPIERPFDIPAFERQPKLFSVYQEYEKWMSILGLDTVGQLNELVASGKIGEYIMIAEGLQEKKIAQIADRIAASPTHPKVVLIAGPSASGKTTFVKRLSIQLRVNGFRPVCISMDDFFLNREDTPRDEYGDLDFESLAAIDSKHFSKVVIGLLRGEEVMMPKFDFPQGRRVAGAPLRIEPDQILLVEGIHGLNDQLLMDAPEGLKFRVYVSPLTHLNIDEHNRIPSSDARLLRRLVRDARYRGHNAVNTLHRWSSVRRGEEKNIFPYQERADVIFNSALPYEISVLAPHAIRGLKEVDRKAREYAEAARLLRFLSYFRPITPEDVPGTSILREFIGGSRFKY